MSTRGEREEQIRLLHTLALRVRNAQSEAPSGGALATLKKALQDHCPAAYVDAVASLVLSGADAARADENHEEKRLQRETMKMDTRYRLIMGIVGFVLVLAVLGLSYVDPDPNDYQMSNIRLIRALCGAAAVGALAGTIKVEAQIKGFVIQATSAAGAFIVLYFFY